MVCKVLKKGIVGAALGAGALALVFGTSAPSYVKTAFWKARSTVKAQVPIQFEIDRARQEVVDLEPAIHQNLESLTKAEVDSEHLEAEIASTQSNLDQERKAIVALRQHLATGDVRLTGNVSYSAEEVKADLARRLDHYNQVKNIQADKQATLKLRKKAVVAAKEQLNKMRAAKLGLMAKVEAIETRLKQIEAAQAANEFNFDDSALARAKQTISELDRRLEVMARVSEREGHFSDKGLPLVIEPGRDVVKEVDALFGTPAADTATADKNL